VRLERSGRALGLGAVLRSDGRILSALSPLGHGNFVQARFADGSTLGVRVVHGDRASDLALLAPDGGHWTAGLRASALDLPAAGTALHRFRARGSRLEDSSVTVSGHQTLLGRDGATLNDMLVLSSRFNDDELGSPLLDDRGEVAAIVVQACAPSPDSCQLSAFGAPVSALRQFLRGAPPREPLPAAWIGFRGVAAHDGSVAGVRVTAIEANGPAAQAGLRGANATRSSAANDSDGDLIVAVEDAPVTTPEEMRDAINRFALSPAPKGDAAATERRVRLLVFGSGKFREVALPVRAPRQLPEAAPKHALPTDAGRAAPKDGSAKADKGDAAATNGSVTAPSVPADKAKSPAPAK
jgi:serine protease Do